jgi:subtilisin family serine protease
MKRKVTKIYVGVVLFVFLAAYSQLTNKPAPQVPQQPVAGAGRAVVNSPVPSALPSTVRQASDTFRSSTKQSKIMTEYPAATEYRYYLLGAPSDPLYASNWAQSKLQTNRAWDVSTGSSAVTVAVIDSPFALNHQDLTSRWYTDTGELGQTSLGGVCWTGVAADKSTNNCDDDGNGYVDDWRGYDFFNNDNNAQAGLTNPNGEGTDHGTMVAGVIAASANNGVGGAGMDWNARIMPLQVFSDDGEAYTTSVVTAIEYAVDNGASIINLSLGTNAYDGPMLAAVQYARSHGVLVVAASGNCVGSSDSFCSALSDQGRMLYPAKFSEVLSVGATSQADTRAYFSSYGPELDLVAPGIDVGPMPVYTAGNTISAYATASGTSFASPVTAGTAALLKAQYSSLTPDQLETILTESTEKPTAMGSNYRTNELGFGRLNAYRALLMAKAYGTISQLGAVSLSPHQPPQGSLWRSSIGAVASDEWLLVGCRVSSAQMCSVAATSGTTSQRFTTALNGKSGEIQFVYVLASSLSSGSWKLSVHSSQLSQLVSTIVR